MDRADFQRLALDHIADAKALLAARRWGGAYYLAGYAVECGLKACILVRVASDMGCFSRIEGSWRSAGRIA